jgi:hypothetical protein
MGFVRSAPGVADRLEALLAAGERDEVLALFLGELAGLALPDCRLVVMPGQRHAAMDTATDLFTAKVLGFLE